MSALAEYTIRKAGADDLPLVFTEGSAQSKYVLVPRTMLPCSRSNAAVESRGVGLAGKDGAGCSA